MKTAPVALLIFLPFFLCAQHGTVSGTVYDARTNQPFVKALLWMDSTADGKGSVTYTDAAGHYSFYTVETGSHVIICYPVSSIRIVDTIVVAGGRSTQHNVVLNRESGTLSGKVCTRTGRPLAGIYVRVDGDGGGYTRTGPQGLFFFKDLGAGTHHVWCSPIQAVTMRDSVIIRGGQEATCNFRVRNEDVMGITSLIQLSLHQGWRTMGEVAIGYAKGLHSDQLNLRWHTLQLGAEFNFDPARFILAPKVSYNYSFGTLGLLSAGVSGLYYTDFSRGVFCFEPHAGFSFYYFQLYAGYNFALMDPGTYNPLRSRLNRMQVSLCVPLMRNRDNLEN
jgi:hypothetical protein